MIEQIGIMICGLTAVFLSQDPRHDWRKWACIFGLCGQPFWFYATWKAGQWGIFGLSFLYAYSWARGVNTYWIKRTPPQKSEQT